MNTLKIVCLALFACTMFTQTGYKKCHKCDFEGKYVCAASGRTYPSKCHAECAGEMDWVEGICIKPCDCLDTFKPVCGYDGQTYRNACTAECQGVPVFDQTAPCPCECNTAERLVCGNDQKTYLNSCHAECVNVGVTHLGACTGSQTVVSFPFLHTPKVNPTSRNDRLKELMGNLNDQQVQKLLNALQNN